MKSGILIVNKEKGITSRDVVNLVCKKLNTKQVGHTGTLDPIATGVLVIGVNDGCKIIELLTNTTKVYRAEIIVGMRTDTLDITGSVEKTYDIERLEVEKIDEVLKKFPKKYWQEVPKYSAIHVQGKRLYEYARNQQKVEIPKREVEILELKRVGELQKKEKYYTFSIEAKVTKGTYIRSLIRDIGKELGIDCTMKSLVRLQQGNFSLQQAISQEEIEEDKIIPITKALSSYPQIIVNEEMKKKILNGMILSLQTEEDKVLLMDQNNQLLAIYERYQKDQTKMKPYHVLGGKSDEKVK